jgi:uncharacterized protein
MVGASVSSDLYRRLKRLKSDGPGVVKRAPEAADSSPPPTGVWPAAGNLPPVAAPGRGIDPRLPPDGWIEHAPLVYIRETLIPLELPPVFAAKGLIESRLLGRTVPARALRFMDTETTGLSGGAGTAVFLVGSGELTVDGLRVRQVLLGDFPGEPRFLERVAGDLADAVWVSYNGKAFDGRLLESRFLMNGMPPMTPEHLDLLTWARRLWRSRIGSCALSDLERSVLSRERYGDIPGFEIPERYFGYLRTGSASDLEPVFEHHRLDIVSLVYLFLRIETVLREPTADPTIDRFQLGRWLLSREEDAALRLLEAAAEEPDSDRVRATLLLARAYRRKQRVEDALRTLEGLAQAGSVAAVVEAAKIYEHDLRDPLAARTLVEACLDGAGSAGVEPELRHRLERLCRKAAKRLAGR